jgi:hypothetical protein
MNKVINLILTAGVNSQMNADDSSLIILTNKIGFYAFLFTTIYVFSYFAFNLHLLGRSQLPFVAFYSLIPLLNHKQKFDTARILFFVSSSIQVFLICTLFIK